MSPIVSIVIPSLNTRDLLGQCLASLAEQSVWPECEAIVVDMSSSDGTVEMLLERFPQVQLLADVPNRGYGAACNAGAAVASGEWLILLNSDVEFRETDVVAELLKHAESRPGDALFGVRLINPDGSPQRSAHGLPGRWALPLMFFAPLRYARSLSDRAMGHLDEAAMTADTAVGWVTGALLLMRRGLFERLGGFDESFFMNSEEVDLATRIHAIGGEVVYIPGIAVVHHGGGSSPSRRDALGWLAEGLVRYTRKHFGRTWLWTARVAAVLAYASSIPVWILRGALGRQKPSEALADSRAFAHALGSALHD